METKYHISRPDAPVLTVTGRLFDVRAAGGETGDKRLRAGLPADWGIADKTGTGDHGAANAIAILRPPGRAPLFVAVYYAESAGSTDERDAVHREVARIIAQAF